MTVKEDVLDTILNFDTSMTGKNLHYFSIDTQNLAKAGPSSLIIRRMEFSQVISQSIDYKK